MSIVATSPQTCLLWELGLWLQPAHKAWRCPQISLTINKSRAAESRNSNPLALCCSLSTVMTMDFFFPSQRTKAAGWHGAQSTLWWCDQTSHVNKTRDRWVRAALPKKTVNGSWDKWKVRVRASLLGRLFLFVMNVFEGLGVNAGLQCVLLLQALLRPEG